jgi:hypothetical protein
MGLTHRSQSALEYMMTYGWAILVIVIVAAVLYSLGIFSPSSSLSTTITGFSNLGTVNAVCLGGTSFTISIGDSTGYPINVTEINLTSSSGKTTYSPNILIQPNSIQTVTVPSSSLCSPGARYSISAVVSYLEPGQIFPGPYTSTGTVAGTANSPPSSATLYEPLTITNTQNQGTPTPFQQMINVTSSSPGWGDISSSPFGQNVEFFSSTGQILESWLESYTSTNAIWWVKLTSSIPEGSKQTIYMGFAPTSTNLFNTNNIGEAPQLSSIYAEYDTGSKVFNYYVNFNGTNLPANWGYSISSGGTCTQDNGMTCTANLAGSNYYCAFVHYTYNLGNLGNTEGFDWGSGPFTQDVSPNYLQEGTGPYCTPGPGYFYYLGASGSTKLYSGGTYTISDNVGYPSFSGFLNSTNHFVYQFNYNTIDITPNNVSSGYFGSNYFAVGDINDSSTPKFYWFDIRNLPPNDIMPPINFGSVS